MIKTLTVTNFTGSMTTFQNGDINSGNAYVVNVTGYNPFTKPGNLTWCNLSSQIDSGGSVVTDLIMAGKERVEGGILYVYAVGHTGRVYKIQVNDPTTFNPDYDNPVLLATITSGTPTFTRGGWIDFFGSTERIYIGHDKGVTRINFDGTTETAISGTWTQTVPRPLKQFIGKLYIGNGSNIAEIDSTAIQTFATKLSPGFPDNTQVRDIDVTPDGNYLQMVVSRQSLPDITLTTQDTTNTASIGSFIFKWNGVDTGYTAFDSFPTYSLTANTMFGPYQYTYGYDQFGASVYNPINKLLTGQEVVSPLPNAVTSTGNILMSLSPLHFDGEMEADLLIYGSLDFEVGPGYWDLLSQYAIAPETDIVQVPLFMPVSNFGIGISSNGYANKIYGTSKFYFSTLESSSGPTTAYNFHKWVLNTSPAVTSGTPQLGVYQTQTQLFSKKVTIKEVRVYGEPWVTNNSFTIDLIGSAGTAITGSSKTFTAGTDLTVGNDFAWYTQDCAPTYAIGLMITNAGTANHVITKVEIDYEALGGK